MKEHTGANREVTEKRRIGWTGRVLALLLAAVVALGQPLSAAAVYAEGTAAEGQTAERQEEIEQPEEAPEERQSADEADAGSAAPKSADVQGQPEAESAPAEKEAAKKQDDAMSVTTETDKQDASDDSKASADADKAASDADKDPYAGLKSLDELSALPDDKTESTIVYSGKDAPRVNERGWAANIYYVQQEDAHYVSFEDDFTLKYQMEFQSSIDLKAGDVSIRVPLSLVRYGEGDKEREVPPAAIGVPQGKENNVKESKTSLFNYYIDSDKQEIVFFNYAEIPANTINAWQVRYDIEASRVQTDARWSFVPAVSVKNGSEEEKLKEKELLPIAGEVTYVVSGASGADPAEDAEESTDGQEKEEKDDSIEVALETEEQEGEEPAQDGGADEDDAEQVSADDAEQASAEDVIEALKNGPEMIADAVVIENTKDAMTAAGRDWSYDLYYINQSDSHYVSKNDDFTLKYQMEFHNSVDIEQYQVQIRLPLSVVKYGHGSETLQEVAPADIGIPQGGYDKETGEYTYTEGRKSDFNYYIDEDTNELVFFNYRKLDSGSDNVWQVLYGKFDVMKIIDMTQWEIKPNVHVNILGSDDELSDQEVSDLALRGEVDTRVQINSVTKRAYSSGASYTPGLYTRKQVARYAPGGLNKMIPSWLPGGGDRLEDHFDEYDYVVWYITLRGYANQPYTAELQDWTLIDPNSGYRPGFVVGACYESRDWGEPGTGLTVIPRQDIPEFVSDYSAVPTSSKGYADSRSINQSYFVVTAYPKSSVIPNQTVLENNVNIVLHPYDKKDSDVSGSAKANWSWKEYKWDYKGDVIGITKSVDRNSSSTLDSWTTAYGQMPDTENLPTSRFTVRGTCRSFKLTHDLDGSLGGEPGAYIPGTYAKVMTVDDAVYAFPQDHSMAGSSWLLGKEDYWFNYVRVTIKDQGYDIYEDEYGDTVPTSETKEADKNWDLDRGIHVFAMFAKEADGSASTADKWEEVGTVAWSSSGKMSYTFTNEQIAREPWRVKVEHNAVDYVTYSDIDTGITIRGDSPAFAQFPDAENVQLENLAGISGEYFRYDRSYGYFQDQDTTNRYKEPGLLGLTQSLYNTILMRDSAMIRLKGITRNAYARKQGTAYNDTGHGRVKVRYRMAANEGYRLFDSEAVGYLKNAGLAAPNRKEVIFYDLLPYGVQFDPSGKVTAGRLTAPLTSASTQISESWDTNQVTVTVDPRKDVISDYRGTGRTLVRFHISYSGRDSSYISAGSSGQASWFTGYGIAFDAYCDYEDYNAATERPNIVAYMPDDNNVTPIIGEESEVSLDDGVVVGSDGFSEYYQDLGADINGDGVINSRNVLYAQAQVFSDIAIGAPANIAKYVRADDDPFGKHMKSTTVLPGKGYEYKITVTNASQYTMQDVVIFDRLENSIKDRQEQEPGKFEDKDWKGTFVRLVTGELLARKVRPVAYYNEDRDAVIPEGAHSLNEVKNILTEANGWKLLTDDTPAEKVKAIALDISTKTDGSPFVMDQMDAVSFHIKMQAPEEMPDNGAEWAYNNPGFFAFQNSVWTGATVIGNSVKIKLIEAKALEIEKTLAEDTPVSRRSEDFRFFVEWSDGEEHFPYAYKEYTLFRRDDDGNYQEQAGLRTTDVEGSLYLADGEKAVFTDADAGGLTVREEDSIRWTQEIEEHIDNAVRTVTVKNKWHPILYVQKEVTGYAQKDAEEINTKPFRMRLTDSEGNAVPGMDLYVVNKALLNGDEPIVTDGTHKLFGNLKKQPLSEGTRVLTTDENGEFDIYPNEIIAIPMDTVGGTYTVTELEEYYAEDSDWICNDPEMTAKVTENGASVRIRNQSRWKDLLIAKEVETDSRKDIDSDTFTFRIYEATGDTIADKGDQLTEFKWQVVSDVNQTPDESAWQDPGPDGEITAACAGKYIRVQSFRADTKLIVEEVVTDETEAAYEVVRGSDYVVVPKFATAARVTILNRYLCQDLEVSKSVITSSPDADYSGKEFTMQLETAPADDDDAFAPAAGVAYTLYDAAGNLTSQEEGLATDEKGCFTLADGQRAYFSALGIKGAKWRAREQVDKDFPPINPAAASQSAQYTQYLSGEFGKDSQANFFNGNGNILIIKKQWVADDEEAKAYLDQRRAQYSGYYSTTDVMPMAFLDLDFDGAPVTVLGTGYAGDYRPHGGYSANQQPVSIDGFKQTVDVPYQLWLDDGAYIVLGLPSGLDADYDLSSVSFTVTESYLPDEYGNVMNQSLIRDYDAAGGRIYAVNAGKQEIVISGTVGEQPIVTVENHLSTYQSSIQKRVEGSDVPAGKELVWRVEQYRDGAWVPAEGVNYLVNSATFNTYKETYSYSGSSQVYTNSGSMYYIPGVTDDQPVPGGTGVTGPDGLIHMVTGSTFYASDRPTSFTVDTSDSYSRRSLDITLTGSAFGIMFDRKVNVNLYKDMKEGDYRVVEVLSESDEEWGYLSTYTTNISPFSNFSSSQFFNYTTSLIADAKTATGFVNSTKMDQIRVEKVADPPSGTQVFTFTLKQFPYLDSDEETRPGANLTYTVYDAETDDEVGQGRTTAGGLFTLLGGQYALIDVPLNSRWQVTESDCHPYHLEKITVGSGGKVVSGNTAEVSTIGDLSTQMKSDMIRIDFNAEVSRMAGGSGRVTNIYFGKTSDYPVSTFGSPTIMDSKGLGTILGYSRANAQGGYDIYIVSDDLMYTNYVSDFMFNNLNSLNSVRFSNVSTAKTQSMAYMFNECWRLQSLEGIESWDTGNVTNMNSMFKHTFYLPGLDLGGWNTSKVTDMSYMFDMSVSASYYNNKLQYVNTAGWDTGNVKSMKNMFNNCSALTTVTGTGGWNTGSVEDMSYMFSGCSALQELDTGSWNTSSVTNMESMFDVCRSLQYLDVSRWNTGKVTNMRRMFAGCTGLASLDVSNWDTSNVTDMSYMFNLYNYGTKARLSSLDVSRWNTSSVTNMDGMFEGCNSIRRLDLSGWDTSNVKSMSLMFYMYNSYDYTRADLEELDVSTWDVSNVENMNNMFAHCSNLKTLDLSKWRPSSVTSMYGMFQQCSGLVTLDLGDWTTDSLESTNSMFYECTGLQSLDMENWDTSKVTGMNSMFYGCSNLETLNIKNMRINSVTSMNSMFYNCRELSTIYCNQNWADNHTSNVSSTTYIFDGCTKLPNYTNAYLSHAHSGSGGYFTTLP